MNKIKIITDCTSDLTDDLYVEHDIHVMSLYVTIGEKNYRDKIDILPEEMFKLVDKYNTLPKTSALTPHDFNEVFGKYINEGYDVLFFGIGGGFSSTFQNAVIASREFPEDRIRVLDSANLSSGIGLLLLKAAKFRDEGNTLAEIAAKIEAIVPNVKSMFSINTLEYLHKGGRCSGTQRFFGSMLKIKPIIRVVDGKMIVGKKPRGKYKAALDAQLEYVMHDIDNIDPDNLFITHCLAEDEDIEYLKEEINKRININNIHVSTASSTIATHCGPRTIGILYIVKE